MSIRLHLRNGFSYFGPRLPSSSNVYRVDFWYMPHRGFIAITGNSSLWELIAKYHLVPLQNIIISGSSGECRPKARLPGTVPHKTFMLRVVVLQNSDVLIYKKLLVVAASLTSATVRLVCLT